MKKRMFVCFFIFTMSVFHLSIPSVVFGQSLAEKVFAKYNDTILREDIQPLLPDVLRAFRKQEIQNFLDPPTIGVILSNPGFLTSIDPDVDYRFVGLLTLDNKLRVLFADEQFQTLLQTPNEIDKLVKVIPPSGGGDCPEPEPPKATTLSIVSGYGQEGSPGGRLTDPFVVEVQDQYGDTLSGKSVGFRVTKGGKFSGQTSITVSTDGRGQARARLTLGSGSGANWVEASVAAKDSLNGIQLTQTFTATAIPSEDDEEDSEEPPMYWIAGNTIYYRPTGGGKEIFNEPQSGTLTGGLAVDMKGGKVYWTEQTNPKTNRKTNHNMGHIQSANLDGTNVQKFKSPHAAPKHIAFDTKDEMLYWTNDVGRIQRIKVGGRRIENFKEDLVNPQHIAFDVKMRRLYWTDAEGIWHIYADNDTGIPRSLVEKEDLGEVRGIAVFDGVVYWTEQTNGLGRVRFMNGTGSGEKLLAVLESESIPGGIAVDPVGGRVYWTTSRGEIRSAPRVIQTVVMGGDEPAIPAIGIALGGRANESAAWAGAAPSLSSVGSVENTLLANYPNPFNPETWIPYQLSASADVSVSIYAVDGRLVRRLDLGHQVEGVYRSRSRAAYWDGRNEFGERVASGLYFYTLTAGDFTATRKMLIRK